MTDHFATIWEAVADAYGDQTALIHGTSTRTWFEFDNRAARLAGAFLDAGVQPGDTVAIDLYNCSEYLEVFFAALKIRAVPANINYRYLDEEMHELLRQADARVLVHHASFADRVSLASKGLGLRLVVEIDDDAVEPEARPTALRRTRACSPRMRRQPGSIGRGATCSCRSPAGPPACPKGSSTSSTGRPTTRQCWAG